MMTVQINDDRIPYSLLYDDIYYSRENGLEESRYVFLKGNSLPDRWRHKSGHVVAETGFGTGLNFLATWQMWARTFTASRQLHYISIDSHPLDKAQLEQVHRAFPELQCLSRKLISSQKQYDAHGVESHWSQFQGILIRPNHAEPSEPTAEIV